MLIKYKFHRNNYKLYKSPYRRVVCVNTDNNDKQYTTLTFRVYIVPGIPGIPATQGQSNPNLHDTTTLV